MPLELFSEADFRVLGLEPGSKPQEVRQAYRTLVKKWHPDRHHSESYEARALAEEKFKEIDQAYRRISLSWKERAGLNQRSSRPANPPTGNRASQRSETKPHRPASRRKTRKFNIRSFPWTRVVLPGLLFIIMGIFLITELISFLPDNIEKTAPPSFRTDRSTEIEPPGQDPSEAAGSHPQLGPPVPPMLIQPELEPRKSYFSLGSSSSDVLKIQGTPNRVQGQTWIYGLSEVQFRNGLVWRFNNFDGSLRVRMHPEVQEGRELPTHITIGSSEEEVLLVQGTPTRVEGNKWFYGFAEIRFNNGRVAEYDNYFGTLKIQVLPAALSSAGKARSYFTIGSTPDEVLKIQGTPTSIQGNRWSFNFSVVSFRDGKVFNVVNPDGSLRYVAPEDLNGREG